MSLNTIKADDVCAFMWARSDLAGRMNACTFAGLRSRNAATLPWNEIDHADRAKLADALADEITKATTPAGATTPSTTQLAIALGKLWNNRAADRDESWCDLDYEAVEYALGHPVDRSTTRKSHGTEY